MNIVKKNLMFLFFFMDMFINPFSCPRVIETLDFHNMWLCVKVVCSILMLNVFSFYMFGFLSSQSLLDPNSIPTAFIPTSKFICEKKFVWNLQHSKSNK
jgi:hypothetical protein